MGEDLGEMLDENPFGAEFDVRLKPRYACGDSIAAISALPTMPSTRLSPKPPSSTQSTR